MFARFLDVAAEGFMRFLLGRGALQILAEAYTQPDNDYSFENVIFAEDGDRVVGMAAGFTAERHRGFSDNPLEEAEGFPSLRMMILGTLLAPLLRILSTVPDDHFYLLAIAIDTETRGRGVGSTLIDFMEERARDSGSTRLTLDVAVKNEGARRLYERCGMIVESRWPKSRLLSPLLIRMTKKL